MNMFSLHVWICESTLEHILNGNLLISTKNQAPILMSTFVDIKECDICLVLLSEWEVSALDIVYLRLVGSFNFSLWHDFLKIWQRFMLKRIMIARGMWIGWENVFANEVEN